MSDTRVFSHAPNEAMGRASRRAREMFRYFWRELSWERRRVIPGLDLSAVKFAFGEDQDAGFVSEQMWVTRIAFDGHEITGRLLNQPRRVSNVQAGDRVVRPIAEITDWIYAVEGVAYGAFTVQVLRAEMAPAGRAQHDRMWGLDFGEPSVERLYPGWARDGHPMAVNLVGALQDRLEGRPDEVDVTDANGMTLLHHMALAGAEPCVRVLIAAGADRARRTARGDTPGDLARTLGWDAVASLLEP